VRLNFNEVVGENRESVRFFSTSSINFSISVFPVIERVIDVSRNILRYLLVLEHHESST